MKLFNLLLLITSLITINACKSNQNSEKSNANYNLEFKNTMQKHLDAIVNRDLETLKTTMSPTGKMTLIMQGTEIINTVDSFINFHEGWFQDSSWSMESKIIKTEIGNSIGLAVTESMYREPQRDGKPYYNRMIVSYVLERKNGNWYIINDHASSIVKSTDLTEEE